MVDYNVNDVVSVGLVKDIPSHQLPPEGWSAANNIRYTVDGVKKGAGWHSVISTAPNSPYFMQSVVAPGGGLWTIFCDLDQVFAWDGSTIANISGPSAPYGTSSPWGWSGTQLAGTPVLTNNVKPPQYWTGMTLASDLADLPDWTASLGVNSSCLSIKSFGPYLVALNVTLATVKHPHGVLWSHPADPGFMPASWGFSDPTKDAGFTELTDAEAGVILDGLPLRGQFLIYKENATWIMKLVGGQYIMQFDPLFLASGILAPHCVALTGDGKFHFVATNEDVIIHDGVNTRSVTDRRMRRSIFSRIDQQSYMNSFVFGVPSMREMWFVFPESGNTAPTRALIWKYGSNVDDGVLSESGFSFRSACVGDVALAGEAWDTDTDTWDTTTDIWDRTSRRRTLLGDVTNKKILQMDEETLRDGIDFTGTLVREALAVDGQRRSGPPVASFLQRKFVRRIWPKVDGGSVNVRVGMTDFVGGSTVWTPSQSFNPQTQNYLDFTVNGRGAPSVEFTWIGNTAGILFGYTMEVFNAGRF